MLAVPRAPRWQDMLVINSTAIHVLLYTWLNGGCPVIHFYVSHRVWDDEAIPTDQVPCLHIILLHGQSLIDTQIYFNYCYT